MIESLVEDIPGLPSWEEDLKVVEEEVASLATFYTSEDIDELGDLMFRKILQRRQTLREGSPVQQPGSPECRAIILFKKHPSLHLASVATVCSGFLMSGVYFSFPDLVNYPTANLLAIATLTVNTAAGSVAGRLLRSHNI